MKTKKIISMLLAAVMLLSALPLTAFAATESARWGEGDTLEEALSEFKVGFDNTLLDWLVLPGLGVVSQRYSYFLFRNERTGTIDEHPVYCIDPTKGGAREIVGNVGPNDDGSNTATYIRGERVGDARYRAIIAAGYPHMRFESLGMESREEGYYATKLTLWMYIRGNDPATLTINPKFGDSDPAALRVRAAAVAIYNNGMKDNPPREPSLTMTGKPSATATLDAAGEHYVQTIEIYASGWIGASGGPSGDVQLSWDSPPPASTIILGTNGEDITAAMNVTMTQNYGWHGKATIKYPASGINPETFSPPILKATAIVPNDEIYIAYAKVDKDRYQRYLVERDPKIELTASFVSQISAPWEEDPPEGTILQIRKVQAGTNTPLAGAVFEVRDPEGKLVYSGATSDTGIIEIPLTVTGNYTVTEVIPPRYHLLSENRTQSVTVRNNEVAEVTFANEPYGTLRVVKRDAANGMPLSGATVQICGIATNTTRTGYTDSTGSAVFEKLPVGAYEIVELTAPDGYELDSSLRTVNILPLSQGETSYTLTNKANPGLRITKFDKQAMTPISGVTFEIYRDGGLYGVYVTDAWGEIILRNIPAGTYTAREIATMEPYVLDPTAQWIEITAGQGYISELVFLNLIKPGIRIVKLDSQTLEPLAGARFKISQVGGSFVKEYITDSNGEIDLSTLTPGAYEVLELAAPDGYIIDDARRIIQLNPGESAQFVFTNTKKPILTIVKTDAQTGQPLAGARFEVREADGQALPGSPYTSGPDGKVVIPMTEPVKLQITEISAPNGYSIDDPRPRIVTVTPGRDMTVSFTDTKKPNLTIRKVDSITGDPIKGTLFQIWQAVGDSLSGELRDLGRFYSDENGEIRLTAQEAGWVRVRELEPASGYGMKDPSTQDVFLEAGKDKVITFENIPLSALIVRKIDSGTGLPVQGATFRVRYLGGTSGSGGTIIYDGVTGAGGSIVLTGLKAGTYVVEEYRAAPGYELSNPSSKTAYISGKDQDVVELVFENARKGGLIIKKLDSVTKQPLAGVTFMVTDSSGAVIGPNNGEYTTDAGGLINIGEDLSIGSTVTVQEINAPDTHILDTTAQTVKIKENTVHTLTFYNTPKGGLQILKLDEETRRPIAGVEFRVARMNGEIIGTYRTDSNGLIRLPDIGSGWFTATETKSAKGYLPDDTVHGIEVKDGKAAVLTVTNRKTSGILIHKVDSVTCLGIPGVTFLLCDGNNKPLGQYESDQDGYVYLGDGLPEGKYKIRELQPAPGYVEDTQVRTIYLEYGRTTEIEWENTPKKGQIVVTKRSAQYNDVTGLPAGSLLSGAVFEVYSVAGNLADRMVSGSNGIAASKLLPLGVYIIKEVSPPKYYALNTREFLADLRHNGDIVRFEVLDENVSLGVTIQKKSQSQMMQSQMILWDLFGIANTSSVALENFYVHDRLPTDAVRGAKVFTGTWSHNLNYRVTYKTNYSTDYRVLASGLSTKTGYELSIHPNVLGLASGEYVTDIRWEFGTAPAGFKSEVNPKIQAQALPTLPKGYKIINRADVGGLYISQWVTAQTSWTTLIYSDPAPAPELPKTGYARLVPEQSV